MHIHHTHSDFADNFFARFEEMKQFMEKHPLLLKKGQILSELHPQRLDVLPKQLSDLVYLIEEEKPLWQNVQFAVKKNNPYTPKSIISELDENQKEFVKEHHGVVGQTCTDSFQKLIEYAVISDTKNYTLVGEDYHHFQTAVDGLNQIDMLDSHLDSQVFLAKKIQAKLQKQATLISEEVQILKESHDSQIALLARLPSFRLK